MILLTLLVIAASSCDEDDGRPRERKNKPTRSASAEKDEPSSPGTEEIPVLTTGRFVTPSGNIHCESVPTLSRLLCDIDYELVPEAAPEFCGADWRGVLIDIDRYAGPACHGDPVPPGPEPELRYGQTWELDGVTCLSERSGLTCRDGSGNGFMVAMAGWSLLGKGAAATATFPVLRNMVRKQAQVDLPDQVASVDFPNLRGGDGCGELQEAFVNLLLTDGTPVIYMACYVSGTWHITDGPLYPD